MMWRLEKLKLATKNDIDRKANKTKQQKLHLHLSIMLLEPENI